MFQDSTPYVEFEEAYLDLELPASALRAGIQKFAWGESSTRGNPTDRLNPAEFTRPSTIGERLEDRDPVDFKFIPDQVPASADRSR
ncbi:MAG: hypothetical protein IPK07_35605 [Deltaproteobacteria bacterium]|nr:hypothetical protein [Deltaproteobacteria bacterium]